MMSNLNKSDHCFSLEREHIILSGRQFGKQLSSRKMLELFIEHNNCTDKIDKSLFNYKDVNELMIIDSLTSLNDCDHTEEKHFFHKGEKNIKAEYKKSPLQKFNSRAEKTAKPSRLLMSLTGGVK